MKKYILIQNDGEIESNSFELIGASTKRDEKGKIGFFGSGLKYSIAYMMRNKIEFRIFSGIKEIRFSTKPETLKDKLFDRICIDGNPTSYTTTMGPTWTQDWFILREIYCNALDEGTCTLVPQTEIVQPSEGKTRIYVELTPALQNISDNWNNYFANDRNPIFQTAEEVYTCYLGTSDGGSRQQISVYPKTEGVLYRRGIRVHSNPDMLYDYGCEYVEINEDRTAKHTSALGYLIRNLIASFPSEGYVKSILRTGLETKAPYEYFSLGTGDVLDQFNGQWIQFSKDNLLVLKEHSAKYAEEILKSKKEVFFLPSMFARELKKSRPETMILGMSNIIGTHTYSEIEASAKILYLLKEVMYSLKEMKYEVPFDIKIVEFDEPEVLGRADVKNKIILLSQSLFDKGRREIALTIMEETEHIMSGCADESRGFQNHIFSQWLKSIEESNAVFL
jgi:hypothetical protein